jgi:hypothetical protein
MDPLFDDNENNDDNIRSPDEVKREQLIEDTRCDFQKQMDEALYLSFQEQQKINNEYEESIIKLYQEETCNRRNKFRQLLLDMNKLSVFDKEVKEIYDIIQPIIDAYCEQYIEICELDELTYERIIKIVSSIRTSKKNIELLKTIIIKPFIIS